MRDDATKDESFKQDPVWQRQKYRNDVLVKSGRDAAGQFLNDRAFTTNSLSGNERNRLFLRTGDDFADVSLVSGTDDLNDGRSFALLDFDHDGWRDLALMSLSAPRFKLYRNRLKELFPDNQSLQIRLRGGQAGDQPSKELSNADGIGARVNVTLASGQTLLLQRQAGEGFAGQNSAVLHVGVGAGDSVESIDVHWPSGKRTRMLQPALNQVVEIHEVE